MALMPKRVKYRKLQKGNRRGVATTGADLAFDHPAIDVLGQDISEDAAPAAIVGRAVEALGGLDIVYNNAGVSGSSPVGETTDEAFDRQIAVNLRAAFRISREAVPHLVKSGVGRLIFTASIMARHTDNGLVAYSASKAGVVGMMRTFALELGRHGVTANAILPGWIATDMTAGAQGNSAFAEKVIPRVPARRWGEPEDFGGMAVYLASDASSYHSGTTIVIDGGYSIF